MKFALSPEQTQFADTLDAVLAKSDVARAWAAGDHEPGLAVWRQLAELGATTVVTDGEPVDMVVVMEAIGYRALPGPAVETVAVLPDRLDGALLATVALPPHVPYAVDADVADRVFTVQDGTLFEATPGKRVASVDPCRALFEVAATTELGPLDGAFDRGVLACAAQLLGAGRALLAKSVEYVRQRTQFGKPIGSYQAVKHHLASVHVGLELARPVVYGAASGVLPASAAKIAAGDAAYRAARTALQVHGAIGYTTENELSLWITKVRALHSAWGTGSVHRAKVMEGLPMK
ncbi:acyl-CoA dehydrogenase family protein [Kibdelosporangium phytohabitans]|uniref:Acyl-CoA dehydrogenase n=1 Tax=Kibdelosporangium phytohabitans TaxID=860235 RepID=A0A0N9ID87_9PSEU|nr:acyl-CoA dehydrogenase family protein [Kibdelosporangium phytohabitans]ALG12683.1 acyl-CoA dehydrogenase [Kibdelosporangium phytohabitans]MBE1464340.1 alkylation response protein AidB-like acyl-CoA dehydrogenase [Kibdelosporangium phytohabitans]